MDENTLISYLKGTLSKEEQAQVEEWVSLSDDNYKLLEDLYVIRFIDERIQAKHSIDVNEKFAEFRRKHLLSPTRNTKNTVTFRRRVASIAAIFIGLLLGGATLTLFLLEKNNQPLFVSTKLGERAQVTLPDGSNVWLNAFSSLEYKKSFLSRNRKALLKGEAYFEVAPNKSLPFVVYNNASEIKVLGTKFNVRCNDDENYISTTLMEGAVLFANSESNINVQLKPSQELIFDKTTRTYKLRELNTPKEILGWIDGKLLFENASLEEIAQSLQRHYNVNITFKDEKVKHARFNAEFEMADNIYQILSILELTNTFTYEINQRNISISSK